MPREKAQAAPTARPKVPMRRPGADCFVVTMKRGNARGAKGAGHRHWRGSTGQREEPDVQWKAAAFLRWHEPDDARVSCPVLRAARGAIPQADSANSALRPCRLDVRFAQKRTRLGDYTPDLDAARRSRALSRAGSTARPARPRHRRG